MLLPDLGAKTTNEILISNDAVEINGKIGNADRLVDARDTAMQIGQQVFVIHAPQTQHAGEHVFDFSHRARKRRQHLFPAGAVFLRTVVEQGRELGLDFRRWQIGDRQCTDTLEVPFLAVATPRFFINQR